MRLTIPTRASGWALRTWQIGLLALAALALVLALAGVFTRPYVFHGSLIDSPAPAPDFTLGDQRGQPFHLRDQAGKVVLLYFGYSSCPDVCPATLSEFALVRRRLGAQADQVRFVLITVDPSRDTADQLRGYLAKFDASFVGLTGSAGELRPVWRGYGVYQDARPDASRGAATVGHSNRVYAIDRQGRLRLTYSLDADAGALAQDVAALLRER
jgi:protein SCO1/2